MKNINDLESSDIICECKQISHSEIMEAIKTKNLSTLEELIETTGAGTCCESCISPENDKKNEFVFYLINYFK